MMSYYLFKYGDEFLVIEANNFQESKLIVNRILEKARIKEKKELEYVKRLRNKRSVLDYTEKDFLFFTRNKIVYERNDFF